jgi:hypothetical protein
MRIMIVTGRKSSIDSLMIPSRKLDRLIDLANQNRNLRGRFLRQIRNLNSHCMIFWYSSTWEAVVSFSRNRRFSPDSRDDSFWAERSCLSIRKWCHYIWSSYNGISMAMPITISIDMLTKSSISISLSTSISFHTRQTWSTCLLASPSRSPLVSYSSVKIGLMTMWSTGKYRV